VILERRESDDAVDRSGGFGGVVEHLLAEAADEVRRERSRSCAKRSPRPVRTEVKNFGDGLMVASAALACAVAMQQSVG
jgi:hypothetical protein